MNNYFKKRMDEIELRTEQMAEKKSYESEIDSLEEKLKGIESNYQRLQTTCKSNLEESALKQVGLVVAKDAHAFAEDMLNKNRVTLVEEKRKLENLHWQVWEEQIKVCDEIGKCIADNNSVGFLNEYPRVLTTRKFASLQTQDQHIEERKKLVAENPEIKELTAEIAALEMAIEEAEDSCLSTDLHNIFTEMRKHDSDHSHKGEIERLIGDLERSHCERMLLEAEISKRENRKIEVPNGDGKPEMSQKLLKDLSDMKTERQYWTSDCGLQNGERWLDNQLETRHHDDGLEVIKKRDEKLKAKKWYEDYAREVITVTNENNCSKILCPPASQSDVSNIYKQAAAQIDSNENFKNFSFPLKYEGPPPRKTVSVKREEKYEDEVDSVEFGVLKGKSCPKKLAKRKNSEQSSQPLKSRFFDKKIKTLSYVGPGFLSIPEQMSHFKLEKECADGRAVPRGTLDGNRKFEPLTATPSTFLESAAEATVDNYSAQSSYHEKPSTSIQGVKNVQRSGKFTPKRPSNIGKKLAYHQTKLDDFDNFMLT